MAEAYDRAAADYDRQVLGDDWMRNVLWERYARLFRPGQVVLDVGCGTGIDALFLAQRGIRVVGIDASVAMVAQARGTGDGRPRAASSVPASAVSPSAARVCPTTSTALARCTRASSVRAFGWAEPTAWESCGRHTRSTACRPGSSPSLTGWSDLCAPNGHS